MKRISTYTIKEIQEKIINDNRKREMLVGFEVNVGTNRLRTFKSKVKCVKCGIEGSFFALEQNADETPHLNLYAIRNKKEILMTSDHIIPKSKGGRGHNKNRQVMCCHCNEEKGNKYES